MTGVQTCALPISDHHETGRAIPIQTRTHGKACLTGHPTQGTGRKHRIGRSSLIGGAAALTMPAIAAPEKQHVLRFMPRVDLVFLDPHFSMTNVTRNHGELVCGNLHPRTCCH